MGILSQAPQKPKKNENLDEWILFIIIQASNPHYFSAPDYVEVDSVVWKQPSTTTPEIRMVGSPHKKLRGTSFIEEEEEMLS